MAASGLEICTRDGQEAYSFIGNAFPADVLRDAQLADLTGILWLLEPMVLVRRSGDLVSLRLSLLEPVRAVCSGCLGRLEVSP